MCKTILKTRSHVTGRQESARQVPVTIYSYPLLLIMPSHGKGKKLEPVFHIFFSLESFPFKIWNSFFSWHQRIPALITEKGKSYRCLVLCVQKCGLSGLVYHSKVGADSHWMTDESSASRMTRHREDRSTRAPPNTAFGEGRKPGTTQRCWCPLKGSMDGPWLGCRSTTVHCIHSCVWMCFREGSVAFITFLRASLSSIPFLKS